MSNAAVSTEGLEGMQLASFDPIDDCGWDDSEEFGELIRCVEAIGHDQGSAHFFELLVWMEEQKNCATPDLAGENTSGSLTDE